MAFKREFSPFSCRRQLSPSSELKSADESIAGVRYLLGSSTIGSSARKTSEESPYRLPNQNLASFAVEVYFLLLDRSSNSSGGFCSVGMERSLVEDLEAWKYYYLSGH